MNTPSLSPAAQRFSPLLHGSAPLKWVFAGDSITHGAAHTLGYRDYTEIFSERIRWELNRRRDCIIKTGISSWKITDLENDFDWSLGQHQPQVVSLNFGMNDCTLKAEGQEVFLASYRNVLQRIRTETTAQVIIHVPNGTVSLATDYHPHLPPYMQAIRDLAVEEGAILVDHAKRWAEAEAKGTMIFWLSDAIHPNEYGHREMAHTLMRELGIFDPASLTGRLLVP